MTGIFVRIQTDEGGYENKEIEFLTDSELDRFIDYQRNINAVVDGWLWVRTLAIWIRENVKDS